MASVFLICELIILFVALPLLYFFDWIPINKINPLLLLFGYCVGVLIFNGQFRREDFKINADWRWLLPRFITVVGIFITGLAVFFPELLFSNLKDNPKFWTIVIITYPLVSVFPQEVIFRKFFFFRYEKLFKQPQILFVVNVILFSFAHIWFMNWVALFLTLLGGIIFAGTYLKSRSLSVVAIEHALYGVLIFAVGLGNYFYRILT
ncbi:MAG: CPBP family intramembrane metalloprotease [Cytophagaceae bacterium]|nr:CPBP family intramembrane metalloprotease [Cytophagaceae bacterium]